MIFLPLVFHLTISLMARVPRRNQVISQLILLTSCLKNRWVTAAAAPLKGNTRCLIRNSVLLLVLIKTASVCLMVIPISSRRAISFPEVIGIGKLQPYARWNENMPDSGASSDLLELGMNYVISGHNARLNANWRCKPYRCSWCRCQSV